MTLTSNKLMHIALSNDEILKQRNQFIRCLNIDLAILFVCAAIERIPASQRGIDCRLPTFWHWRNSPSIFASKSVKVTEHYHAWMSNRKITSCSENLITSSHDAFLQWLKIDAMHFLLPLMKRSLHRHKHHHH
jgi:hypothetical protein